MSACAPEDELRAPLLAGSALQQHTELQRALAEYCCDRGGVDGGAAGPGAAASSRRSLQQHASDPMVYHSRQAQLRENGVPGPSTPGEFRRHYLQKVGASRSADESLVDFILDVAFDVQEHYQRLSQRYAPPLPNEEAGVVPVAAPQPCGGGHGSGHRQKSSDVATVLVILKSFVGGTLLVVPAEFLKSGLLSGTALFWAVGLLELRCMLKLLEVHRQLGGSFGQLAGRALGPLGTAAVDGSIVLSQLGFIAAEMIYVAKNGSSALRWAMERSPALGLSLWGVEAPPDFTAAITWLQLLLVVPVAWYRELTALTVFNFAGNFLVMCTLLALSAMTTSGLSEQGVASDWELVCPLPQALVFLGFSTFTFEGVNMVIPMYTAHRDKDSFRHLLILTILAIIMIFSGFAGANVLLYGQALQPILTLNLPQGSAAQGLVPAAFSVASLALVPLMAFPTFQILEGSARALCKPLVGTHSRVNAFRAVLLVFCAAVAQFAGEHLGAFLSLVGAVGCVPLAFVYPSVIHLRLMACSRMDVLGDCVCIAIGIGITMCCTASVFWHSG